MPDKVVITPLIDAVLSWDLAGRTLPHPEVAVDAINQLTSYGRILTDSLRAHTSTLPIVGEADRRLNAAPSAGSAHAATARAQNLARLVQALLNAIAQADALPAPRPQHAITKGTQ